MRIPQRFLGLTVLFLALLASCESRRSAYRLPKPQGRSASGSPSPQDVGSGRDFMKKFMMMRGMFQQPPSDNVIIITQPSTTTTTTTTPSASPSTTTTTTTTPTSNSTGRSFDGTMDEERAVQDAGLEDRLDLPLVEQEVKEAKKPKFQKRFRVKKLQLNGKRSQAKKKKPLRRVHRHHKKIRTQKKTPQNGNGNGNGLAVNQQRNSESPSSSVDFIEPYHNDRPQKQTSQSGSDSRLQRIWRRFQIAN